MIRMFNTQRNFITVDLGLYYSLSWICNVYKSLWYLDVIMSGRASLTSLKSFCDDPLYLQVHIRLRLFDSIILGIKLNHVGRIQVLIRFIGCDFYITFALLVRLVGLVGSPVRLQAAMCTHVHSFLRTSWSCINSRHLFYILHSC